MPMGTDLLGSFKTTSVKDLENCARVDDDDDDMSLGLSSSPSSESCNGDQS